MNRIIAFFREKLDNMGHKEKRNYLIAALLVVMLIGFYFLNTTGAFENEKEVQYETVSEIALPMNNVKTLNPAASTDQDTYYITRLVYDGLFGLDETMTPYQNLAKSYEYDAENRVIYIDLVDTTWQDGEPLTGYDVVFTIQALQAAGSGCNYKDIIDGVDYAVYHDNSVEIHFISQYNMSLDKLTFPILPAHVYDSYQQAAGLVDENFIPVGTGPYKVQSYSNSDKLTLVPNENYHGTVPENTLIFDTEGYSGDVYQRLQSGGISVLISKDMDRETYITKGDIKIVDFPANQMEFMCFNCNDQDLKDPLVRQAICYATDSEAIIESAYYNSGILNDNIFFPGYLGVDSSEEAYPYDLKKAAELLEEAGYVNVDTDGNIMDESGRNLTITIAVKSGDVEKLTSAETLQQSLEDLGIRVTINQIPAASYYKTLQGGNYDIYFGTYTFNNEMDMRALLSYQTTNYSTYANEDLMAKLDDLRSGHTVEEAQEIYLEIKQVLEEEVPYYCVCYRTYGAIMPDLFLGEVTPVWNNYYYNCGDWKNQYIVNEEKDDEEEEK